MDYIINHTYLNFGVFNPQYRKCKPFQDSKNVTSGNSILSIYPLHNIKIHKLTSEFLGILNRHIIEAKVEVNNKKYTLMNVHAIVGGLTKGGIKRRKRRSMNEILKLVNLRFKENKDLKLILGGDFNNTPYVGDGTVKLNDFKDAIVCSWPKRLSSDYNKTKDLMRNYMCTII